MTLHFRPDRCGFPLCESQAATPGAFMEYQVMILAFRARHILVDEGESGLANRRL